jgi:hypothetical protein
VTRPQGEPGGEESFEDFIRDVIARADPVPDTVVAEARAARSFAGPSGSDLLELVYDSLLDADVDTTLGSRFRLLSFGGRVRVDLRVEACGDERRLTGWTVPVPPHEVSLRTEHDTVNVRALPDGSFCASCAVRERVSFLLDLGLDVPLRRYHTSWVVV